MKNKYWRAFFGAFVLSLFSLLNAQAQNVLPHSENRPVNPVTATISENLVINLPTETEELNALYVIDIEKLQFKSEENLNYFCELFSLGFYQLKGDFQKHRITVEIDKQAVEKSGMSITKANTHFEGLAKRMQYIYNKSNL